MKTYKSDNSQTVFDVAMLRYGSLDGLATLLADNPALVLNDGTIAQYGVTHLVGEASPASSELEKTEPARSINKQPQQRPEYRSNIQQTVFDVALMQYGGVEGLVFLLADNPALVQENGLVSQFGVSHLVQTKQATNARMKRKMLALVPCTGDKPATDDGAWITDDGLNQDWITDDGLNKDWITD